MAFARRLVELSPPWAARRGRGGGGGRRWVFVAYDQLTSDFGPVARTPPGELGVVLVECPDKAARRPYHRQKLALVLTNLRHYALEQAARGVAVRYVVAERGQGYGDALAAVVRELGPLDAMAPAERELRRELLPLVEEGAVRLVPHEGWLTTRDDFVASQPGAGPAGPFRMDAFYRYVRKRTGVLVRGGRPEGGKWSFDTENRRRWTGDPPAPWPLVHEPDDVTREVGDLVTTRFAEHPGELRLDRLPATADDAERVWARALRDCLPSFGPYEDAMSRSSRRLFHAGVSPLLNLSRLSPARLVRDAADADAPLPSREGFVRQVLGWREFVRHVHAETDGFRLAGATPDHLVPPGDAAPLPPVYWGGAPSGLACLDDVVETVWQEAHSHHITRLMVLSNVATLLDVSARELSDWFWVAYDDAYDWVVEPNVLAMGTFATGPVLTTKPYVAGAAYVDRMSDYCAACAFDPKTTCPLTRLYWAFLARHRDVLEGNLRLALPLASAAKRSPAERTKDEASFARVREALGAGERLAPEAFEDLRRD